MVETCKQIEDEAFWQLFIPAEEDRRELGFPAWAGGYRWFRSTNVIPLEQWRKKHNTNAPAPVKASPLPE